MSDLGNQPFNYRETSQLLQQVWRRARPMASSYAKLCQLAAFTPISLGYPTMAYASQDAEHLDDDAYRRGPSGIFTPEEEVQHRDEEYDEAGFDVLLKMQAKHFWYRGRHRFLLHAFRQIWNTQFSKPVSACDLGGGCGGWIRYLQANAPDLFRELALTDSSLAALGRAERVLGTGVRRYQTDLLNLQWENRWDVAYLLDVLEHIPDDAEAMRQIHRALKPGGLLLAATPALKFFWSYNDDLFHHQRRYSRADFSQLASTTGFELCDARYFMFLLSPLLYVARRNRPDIGRMSKEEIQLLLAQTHRVPAKPVNTLLTAVFSAETPLGHWLRFPWGTSILGIFRKPD